MPQAPKTIVRFPSERVTRVAIGGPSWSDRVREHLRGALGNILNRAGIAGAIQAVEIHDREDHLAVTIGTRLVRLSVNGRDYYFDRISGRYDGTGCTL